MKCHGKNENKSKHSPMKHMFLMILCCGLPILIAISIPFLNISNTLRVTIGSITPFICPIMMIFMIPMMLKHFKSDKSCGEDKGDTQLKTKNEL